MPCPAHMAGQGISSLENYIPRPGTLTSFDLFEVAGFLLDLAGVLFSISLKFAAPIVRGVTDRLFHRALYLVRCAPQIRDHNYVLASAALTRAGVNGAVRNRTPVASKTALPTAAATGALAASPAP